MGLFTLCGANLPAFQGLFRQDAALCGIKDLREVQLSRKWPDLFSLGLYMFTSLTQYFDTLDGSLGRVMKFEQCWQSRAAV